MPSENDLQAAAPQDSWEERYAKTHRVWSGNPNATLVDLLTEAASGTVLELGCGEGADAVWLAERGWLVTAVDISATAIAHGRQLAASHRLDPTAINWVVADLDQWEPSASFDLVTASFLHSPTGAPGSSLASRGAGWVKPGGRLLVIGHASPPPGAPGFHHHLPNPTEQLTELTLGPEWVPEFVGIRVRPASAVHGGTTPMEDAVVLVRRDPRGPEQRPTRG